MKDIILDDRKQYLPNLCMVVLTLICLALIWIGGILFHNSALVSTLIGLYAIIMVLVGVVMISMAGKAFMADMRNQGIWKMRKNQGKSLLGVIGCKTTLYAGLLFVTEMLYALVMAGLVFWTYHSFDEEKEAMDELFAKTFGENYSLSGKNAVIILEFVLVAVTAIALLFFAVTIVYNGFSRGRYAGVLAGVLYVSVGYAIVRITLGLTSKAKGEAERSLKGSLIMAILAAACLAAVWHSTKKHQWDAEEQL